MAKSSKRGVALKHGYGWLPDLPDQRDHFYAAPAAVLAAPLPAKVDLRSKCPKVVYDQGQLGSCTANAIAGAIEFDQIKQHLVEKTPSRLFIYYNERDLEGRVSSDSGAFIRDGIKSVSKLGVCPEEMWPYDVSKFTEKPLQPCYTAGLKHKVTSYQRLDQTLTLMKRCLASGYPFVFGFTVYESFESQQVAQTGVVPMPASTESTLGGHAVLAVGYVDTDQRFICRNSWSKSWGMKGYFTIPYAYLLDSNLSSDFWTIRIVN